MHDVGDLHNLFLDIHWILTLYICSINTCLQVQGDQKHIMTLHDPHMTLNGCINDTFILAILWVLKDCTKMSSPSRQLLRPRPLLSKATKLFHPSGVSSSNSTVEVKKNSECKFVCKCVCSKFLCLEQSLQNLLVSFLRIIQLS